MKQTFMTAFPHSKIKADESLSHYTYTKTGGPADWLIFPESITEVAAIIKWLKEAGVPVTFLGNASNVIIKDGGIRGAVIMLTSLKNVEVIGNYIIVDAGAKLIDVSRIAYEQQLSGLEFACGIPGSVGGAVYMNAGAYGGEISVVIDEVTLVTASGDIQKVTPDDLDFSYRHSAIQESDSLVVQATFKLQKGDPSVIQKRMAELTHLRESKQPLEYPSCGSVFKRPKGHFTGQLIQEAGLQGYQIGGVQVSQKHAGFMVNIANGTATDYMNLIHYVQKVIKEKFDVDLEPEVRIIGQEVTEKQQKN